MNLIHCPRIVIAGTQSGVGKTSVALALTYALKQRGLKVQTFKAGPDFLDPTYLSLASAKDCYNLDGWMSGREYVCNLFAQTASGADISVIEGVMGLFDGADPKTSEGSSAEIAEWLKTPVLLVLNAKGLSRSVAAMVKGYCDFDPNINIAGVIANNCGSEKHREILSESLKAESLPPLLGAIPKNSFPTLPSRHLGLFTADGDLLSQEILETLAEVFEKHASIDEIIKLSNNAPPLPPIKAETKITKNNKTVRIGLAYDKAFHFYYPDTLKALEARGCEFVKFSPLNDDKLDDRLDGIYIGGGYPEEYAETLSANSNMLNAVKNFALSGRPVYGECGGLIYLSEGVETISGNRYPLCGLLPSWTKMRKSFKSLGYVEITMTEDSIIGLTGQKLRGHKFHYSELTDDPTKNSEWRTVYSLEYRRNGASSPDGFRYKNILASYVHPHIASSPDSVEQFANFCGESR